MNAEQELWTHSHMRKETELARDRNRHQQLIDRRQFKDPEPCKPSSGSLQELVRKLKISQFLDVDLLMSLKQLLSNEEFPVDVSNEFFTLDGALQGLVSTLTNPDSDHKIQLLAAQCVANLTPLNEKNGVSLARSVGPYLVTLLGHGHQQMCEASGVALGNLALAGSRVVKVLMNQEVVPSLVSRLKDSPSDLIQAALFYALYHILHSSLECNEDILSTLVSECERSISVKCPVELHWVMFVLSCNPLLHNQLTTSKLIYKCFDVCTYEIFQKSDSRPLVKIVTPIIRTLANICAGPQSEKACLIVLRYPDIMAIFMALLATNYSHLCKETLWLLSNIMNNESLLVQEELMDLEFMEKLEFHTSQAIQKVDPYLQHNTF